MQILVFGIKKINLDCPLHLQTPRITILSSRNYSAFTPVSTNLGPAWICSSDIWVLSLHKWFFFGKFGKGGCVTCAGKFNKKKKKWIQTHLNTLIYFGSLFKLLFSRVKPPYNTDPLWTDLLASTKTFWSLRKRKWQNAAELNEKQCLPSVTHWQWHGVTSRCSGGHTKLRWR